MVYASVTLINMNKRINEAQAQQEALSQQVAEKEVSNAEIQYAIDNKDDDETKADIARDSLGLVDPDEKVFLDSGS
ncbi:MAG: septum formation initiator family protein [Oscillospiraceae bacterium]|nr:septum formation initiator family protein [Oscillospiraceae bacterium]